jgi:hypothetical protein
MGVSAEVHTWPQLTIAPGQQVTFVHWVVDEHGHSLIEPGRWYWMSAVPDYGDVRPDRPVPAATIEAVAQRPVREWRDHPGPSNTDWLVTWRNPGSTSVQFKPQLLQAPAR